MLKNMLQQYNRFRHLLLYLIFGVLTTIVNIVIYSIGTRFLNLNTIFSTCFAWIIAVLFAYITNKIWVFESYSKTKSTIIKEMKSFLCCRFTTGILDVCIMYFFVDFLGLNDLIIKVASNVVVIIVNYAASKFIVFKREELKKQEGV